MNNNTFSPANILYISLIILVDFIVFILSLNIVIHLEINFFQKFLTNFNEINLSKYYWIIFITIFIFIFEKIYFVRYDFWSDTKRVYKGLFISFFIVFTVISLSKMSEDYSRMFVTFFFIIMFFILPFSKRVLKKFLFRFDLFKQRIKIIGNSSLVNKMEEEINNNWYLGYKVVDKNYDLVIIISKNIILEELNKLIKRYSKRTRNIYVVPYMFHLDFTNTNVVDYFNIRLSSILIENRLLNLRNVFIKYIFEKSLVIFIFPLALIIHLFIYTLIKIDSKGSVFFKQKRLGKNGKTFSCYKYRSMYINGDEILKEYLLKNPQEIEYYNIYHKYKNDPRVTKIGKFLRATSLDEFPQFFNILRGDINLIGPRPYMLNEKIKIGKNNEDIILKTKPGITGLWQVSGRNELTFKERIELDKWYIQNWSLWMDFVIFMKTIKVVFFKIGAR